MPVSAADWSGPHIGANVGYGWGDGDTSFEPLPTAATFINFKPTTLNPDPSGVLLGGQVGYNWQSGKIVPGVEADISWANIRGSTTQSPIIQNNGTVFPGAGNNSTASEKLNWFGTIRGRLGYVPADKWLVYATGGLAVAKVKYSANTDFRPVGTEQYPNSVSDTKFGWTLGLGAEWAAFDKVSVKAEYLYYDLGDKSDHANPSIPFGAGAPAFGMDHKWDTSGNIVRFGLNYNF